MKGQKNMTIKGLFFTTKNGAADMQVNEYEGPAAIEKAVGGDVGAVYLSLDYIALFNQQAEKNLLAPSGVLIVPEDDEKTRYDIMAGDFFICRIDDNEDVQPLNDLDVQRLKQVTKRIDNGVTFNNKEVAAYFIDLVSLNKD